jgi:hypothetical protein
MFESGKFASAAASAAALSDAFMVSLPFPRRRLPSRNNSNDLFSVIVIIKGMRHDQYNDPVHETHCLPALFAFLKAGSDPQIPGMQSRS